MLEKDELQKCAAKEGATFQPFEIAADYSLYVEGNHAMMASGIF